LSYSLKLYDIGFNGTDPVFRGIYHDKQRHEDDFGAIIERAKSQGVERMMLTGDTLEHSEHALELCEKYDGLFACTAGVHPCQAEVFDKYPEGSEVYLEQLESFIRQNMAKGKIVAFGEIGLDYDRLHYANKETQLKCFEAQLGIATKVKLPLFLHSRAAADDFVSILSRYLPDLPKGGVVHSFTGSLEELDMYLKLGLYIGVNGCSLKTETNVEAVRRIPLDRLLLETDAPWCEVRPSHEGYKFLKDFTPPYPSCKKERFKKNCMVRGRNEPCNMVIVAKIVAEIKNISVEELCETVWKNSVSLLG
ncbi:TatD protein, partial [Schizosaccharomyces japonicus yFS275]